MDKYRRQKNVQRGTAPNRIVGFLICENRTETNRTISVSENCTEPTAGFVFLKTAPNRTLGVPVFQNRTEPHRRRIYDRTEPHRMILILYY